MAITRLVHDTEAFEADCSVGERRSEVEIAVLVVRRSRGTRRKTPGLIELLTVSVECFPKSWFPDLAVLCWSLELDFEEFRGPNCPLY